MKNIKNLLILLLVVAALIVVKIVFLTAKTPSANAVKAGQNQTVNVTVIVAKSSSFQTKIVATGTTLSNEEVDLKPEASGKITQILFKEGDKVSKGELLLKLNDADLVATLQKLELNEKLASDKESRLKRLLEIKGVSQEEYDAALNALQGIRADMDFTRAQIAKTELHAPFDGVIGLKSVSEGSYVAPTVKIASMQQLDPIKIDFFIPEKYSGMVHKGGKLTFHIQGQSEQFEGLIYAIEPKIDLATRTLQLRGQCPNKSGKILPGSFAEVSLTLNEAPNIILIPTEALVPVLKGQNVFVVKGGKALSVKVETGARTDEQIEIVNGLLPGDSVITTGIMQLKSGQGVRIVDSKQDQ
jgi:membrane fusion protein (multidrug efflux system)